MNFFVRCSRRQGSNVFLRRFFETHVEILLQVLVRDLANLQRGKWALQESVDSQNLLLCTTLLSRLGVSVGDQPICHRDLVAPLLRSQSQHSRILPCLCRGLEIFLPLPPVFSPDNPIPSVRKFGNARHFCPLKLSGQMEISQQNSQQIASI